MTAVIIEDELLLAKDLEERIRLITDDIEILEKLPSLKTARRWFMQNGEPDLLFMDVQLADGVSFELFGEFELKCPVIFITAYDEYAIRAFKVNGIDYLLKPVADEDLSKAIQKATLLINSKSHGPDPLRELMQVLKSPRSSTLYKEKFIVQLRHQWIPVKTADIACFIKDNLNYLVCFNGDKFMIDYTTLEEVEELLDPRMFYRANRQFIVHIDAIHSVKPHENQKLTLTLKAPLKNEVDISREKAPSFKKWLDR